MYFHQTYLRKVKTLKKLDALNLDSVASIHKCIDFGELCFYVS